MARDTLALVEHQMKTAGITVALGLESVLPKIQGNPGKLQQVFLNLLLNAKDAMPQGGELRVGTTANGHVEATIADFGAGIAPEHLKRIYDPFFTTKSAPKPGERRGTDERMLELLEPFRGHRARVIRLLLSGTRV